MGDGHTPTRSEHTERPVPLRGTSRMSSTAGMSLVELLVALVILSVGLLAVAGGTALIIQWTTVSELQTQRTAALQSGVEEIRAIPFEEVGEGSKEVNAFRVNWEAEPLGPTDARTKEITIAVTGPGRNPDVSGLGAMSGEVADTTVYRLIRREDL